MDDSGFHELKTGGMILGPSSDSAYVSGKIHLAPGSMLAMFSDGLLEQTSTTGTDFGIEMVKNWMVEYRYENAAVAIQALLDRLADHGGFKPWDDDVTIVLIRRQPATL